MTLQNCKGTYSMLIFKCTKSQSMAILYGRKCTFNVTPLGMKKIMPYRTVQNSDCQQCHIKIIWFILAQMASNLTLKLGRKNLAFFDIFCFGQKSDFIRIISSWALQIFKIPILPLQFFNRMHHTIIFQSLNLLCILKLSCYSSNINLFYENSSDIHCRQFLCHKTLTAKIF